jgi:hypothetical protein
LDGSGGTEQKPAIAGEIETFPFETAARIVVGWHDVMSRHTAALSAYEKPALHDPRASIPWKGRKSGRSMRTIDSSLQYANDV